MDAHVFRRVGAILAQVLCKARLERIHEPVPGVTAFSLYVSGEKRCLLCRRHRSVPLLFITERSPLPNPAFPPAAVMRLRKYAEGRILGEARCNWVERQLAFALPHPEGESGCFWLLLDCKNGPAILESLPPDFSTPPPWPAPADIPALLRQNGEHDAPWEAFRVLTPLLRRTLALLSPEDAAALLVDLEAGDGDLFWYAPAAPSALSEDSMPPRHVCAWPLPPGAEESAGMAESATPAEAGTVLPLLEAMQLPLLLAGAKAQTQSPAIKQDKSALRRHKRLLATLETEKNRLAAMLLLGDEARLLQANLWRLQPDARLEAVTLPRDPAKPADPAAPKGETVTIRLNSLMSVTENMQAMFRKASKAARGLAMLDARLALLRDTPPPAAAARPLPEKASPKTGKKTVFSPSLIQEFVSSDGFALWRGRSAEGNRALLKLARPFDLWFHVEDGPSAHLLLRRDHAAQEVPERTLREAAALVGLKSWRKDDPKAPVMVALAKHVQPIKGAASGTVRVQERLQTLLVSLEASLEQSLRPDNNTARPKEGESCTTRK
ncbi:conserved hypothetical protein [uncultured delta proteobacterium]|uniref:NFACT RNA-binding domain-containing protein n=1 Tax=uncultured delta proteobacterium TaxID=34034 RepID=A0A212J275_9DELT|nr:conserved hypothetical protein [uncultured delta proteobacterium]